MTTYRGSDTVNGGFYFETRRWTLEMIEGETGTLPGEAAARYVRIPVLALILFAPLMGLLFVLALPFIGLAVVGEQAWRMTVAAASASRQWIVKTATVPRR